MDTVTPCLAATSDGTNCYLPGPVEGQNVAGRGGFLQVKKPSTGERRFHGQLRAT